MARNDFPNEEMEQRLREHFAAEGRVLHASEGLWEQLEGRLTEQAAPRRLALLRGGADAMRSRAWWPAAAAAAVGVAVGIAIWSIAGDGGDGSGDNYEGVAAAVAEAPAAKAPAAAPEFADEHMDDVVATQPAPPLAEMPMDEEMSMEEPMAEEMPMDMAYDAAPALEAPAVEPAPSVAEAPAAAPRAAPDVALAPEPSPADTTFQDYGRVPFVETSIDPVSTFSLDTDRTSYYLALSWARSGYAVLPDSVRAEEWVNAFAYDYDPPHDSRGFAVTSDVAEHPLDGGRHLARIAFQAPELRDDTPLNVTLVLDASGSMGEGNRVAIAREAAETIRRSLAPRDRIAVVHFTTDVIDRFTVEHREPEDAAVVRSISHLAPHEATNVQAGLDLGVQLADRARRVRPDAYNYIILMSDGVANVDATDPFAILEAAGDSDRGNPLRLIAIGVGIHNYNDYLLEQLAQHGNGWYRYLDNPEQARATFSRENWLALSVPYADQTRAQVTWDPDIVQSWRIVGYENRVTPDHTFEQNRREFAEIYSGAATTVFYEIELRRDTRERGALLKLGDVELRWVDPSSGASLSQRAQVAERPVASFGALDDPLFRLGAIVALASDRYSSLSYQYERAAPGVHADLADLQDELRALEGSLGRLDAYRDFAFLLDVLTETAGEAAPPSGYSR